jgi:putative sterol carrier protein
MEETNIVMASIEECSESIAELAARLSRYDSGNRQKKIPDRTLSLHIMDHDILYQGCLHQGELVDIEVIEPGGKRADIRISMTSDDLLALTAGQLHFAHAWATGKVRIDASLRDLLRLRSFG